MNTQQTRAVATLLCGLLLFETSACGGSDGAPKVTEPPPKPTPVVTTVEVLPASVAITEGDSTRLTATVKDQFGATMPDKTLLWSSSTPAVATVSGVGVVTAVGGGAATITAIVEGKSGLATINVGALPRVGLDASKSVNAQIGVTGGSLNTTVVTAAGAATILFSVPAASLTKQMAITMTPVTVLRRLPAGGEFIGGVQFGPTGLGFPHAATLKVVMKTTVPAGKKIYGFVANDTGAIVAFAPVTQKGDTLILQVSHFSMAGFGQFVPGSVPTAPLIPNANVGSASFQNQLAAAAVVDTPLAMYVSIFRSWYLAVIEIGLGGAATTDTRTQAAVDYEGWVSNVQAVDQFLQFSGALVAALATERSRGNGLARAVITQAIADHIAQCKSSSARTLDDAQAVMQLETDAQALGLDTFANGLDFASVTASICPKIFETALNFPAVPDVGTPAQLDVTYGLQFGTSPQIEHGVFKVTLDVSGTTTDGRQVAQTDNLGQLSGNVIPTGNDSLVINLTVCHHPSLGYRLDEICAHETVLREFGTTINGDVVIGSQLALQQLNNVSKITGNLIIATANVTSSDLHELRLLKEVGGAFFVRDVPNFTGLFGLSKLQRVGSLTLRNLPLVTTLASFRNTAYAGLDIEALPALASLSGLATPLVTLSGKVRLVNNAKLFDASIFRGLAVIQGDFEFTGNPLFRDYNDFGVLVEVDGNATFGGQGVTTLGALSRFKIVGGNLTVMLNEMDGITTFQLPSLLSIGKSFIVDQTRAIAGTPPAFTIPVSFPALTSVQAVHGVPGSTPRSFSLSLSSVAVVRGDTTFAVNRLSGMKTLALAPIFTNEQTGLHIEDNPDLVALSLGIMHTGKSLRIQRNFALRTLVLGNLAVGQLGNGAFNEMQINNNTALDSVQFTDAAIAGGLFIHHNAALQVVKGRVTTVEGEVQIHDNPLLPTDAAIAWALAIRSVFGEIFVFNNRPPPPP
ncbi:MAG: Ig-like domain-containing protein [Gemmatimonas sp.]